ncbi:hypothetical protein POX_f07394 [Penicillium oxalicum]|uniref:hypothetical protein n=1 Tax=Penicillium oxalicum TaxID=69781 RepID=UPI0020B7F854|nr:hypothetical protein POX_f07394 [Penicillium oxalicum]KAI2787039.1 hypothetical protein POX_f07394 [Penicillium oxalicum]
MTFKNRFAPFTVQTTIRLKTMGQESSPEFEKVIGHHFHDQGLLEEALEESGLSSAGNERLALVGDKILALMLLRRWYREGNTTGMFTSSRFDIRLI